MCFANRLLTSNCKVYTLIPVQEWRIWVFDPRDAKGITITRTKQSTRTPYSFCMGHIHCETGSNHSDSWLNSIWFDSIWQSAELSHPGNPSERTNVWSGVPICKSEANVLLFTRISLECGFVSDIPCNKYNDIFLNKVDYDLGTCHCI